LSGSDQKYGLLTATLTKSKENIMKNRKFIGSTVLALGLLATGSSFAADQKVPVAQTPEQRTEMQKKREQNMEQKMEKNGQGEQKQHREMNQERVNETGVSGAGSTRPR
jgi:hypothetical protein